MCGITGFWLRGGADAQQLQRTVTAMAGTLLHRGPDDGGAWVNAEAGIALAQRRLSIIDLSPAGHQPMASSNGRYVITYNGEIYNFTDLRSDLEAHGVCFRGHSDTEVIVEGLAHWGVTETLSRLNGMFAMAIWDNAERSLYLARDRMGEKPLYWAQFGPLVLFGSELKALRAHPGWQPRINRDIVPAFLRHNYIPAPFTIYEGVFKLLPAGFVRIRHNSDAEPLSYWDLGKVVSRGGQQRLTGSEDELVEELDALLRDAVSRRMVADVPVGAFLSGGYDSSAVVALMQHVSSQPVRTFTISFDNAQFDESKHAEAVAHHLGTDHITFPVTGAEAQSIVPDLSQMYDEPFADSSQIPTHIVSALTRRKVTVALSGDGGDELFSGYNRYQWAEKVWGSQSRSPLALRRMASRLIQSVPPAGYDRVSRLLPYFRNIPQVGHKAHRLAETLTMGTIDDVYYRLVSHHERPVEFVPGASEARADSWSHDLTRLLPDAIDRMRYRDMCTYLPDDILTKVDRASMRIALEVRVPFLDHRVVEWVWRLPSLHNARASRPKHLLRRVLARYVPDRLVDRPKMGFGVPLADWLRGPLRPWADDLMNERRMVEEGIFDAVAIQTLWRAFVEGTNHQSYFMWNILMFQAWLREWNNRSTMLSRAATRSETAYVSA